MESKFVYQSSDVIIQRKTDEWFKENTPMLDILLRMNAVDNAKEGK
jgi:hypothetical protein